VGLVFSFGFFAAHMKTQPYRHAEDNLLTAMTEIHLFAIMMLCLILKSDLQNEFYRAEDCE
jgi:hypothetical protein